MRGCRLLDCQPDFSYVDRDYVGNRRRPLIILQKIQAAIIVISVGSENGVRDELEKP